MWVLREKQSNNIIKTSTVAFTAELRSTSSIAATDGAPVGAEVGAGVGDGVGDRVGIVVGLELAGWPVGIDVKG